MVESLSLGSNNPTIAIVGTTLNTEIAILQSTPYGVERGMGGNLFGFRVSEITIGIHITIYNTIETLAQSHKEIAPSIDVEELIMRKNQLDCIAYVDDRLIEKAEKYVGVKKKNTWAKWGAIAACFCLVAVGALTVMPKYLRETDAGTGRKQPVSGGINEGSLYSVAVLPADRNRDDVRKCRL